jgi:predicted DNA-binding protein
MATKSKRITVYVPDELYERVYTLAEADGRSMTDYIARLLARKLLPPQKVPARA